MANTYWQPLNYGYTPVYWLTVSGVPVVFTERATGKALPGDFGLEDAALVIDDSAEVGVESIDRDRGLGVGLDLTFKLLDTATVRDWLRKWSKQVTLTQDLAAADVTAHVDDTTGWAGVGILYVGLERIQYGGKTATTFTGLTRATCESLATTHKAGTVGQVVTDRPRHWRGRDVTLWASLCDPSGHLCGTALQSTEARQVWRGRITAPPERHADGFAFHAQSIDRLLDEPLAARMTGDVKSTATNYLLQTGWGFGIYFKAVDAAGTDVWTADVKTNPFAGMTATYATPEEIRTLITTAWASAVTAGGYGADLGDLTWKADGKGKWHARIQIKQNAAVYKVFNWFSLYDGTPQPEFGAGMLNAYDLDLNWDAASPPWCPKDGNGAAQPTGLTLRLTEGDPAEVPPTGKVAAKAGNAACTYTYAATGTAQGDLHLEGLKPLQGQTALNAVQLGDGNATAEVLLADAGTFDDLALNCLESSGTGLRGTYDVLAQGAGYALPDTVVKEASFTAKLGAGTVGTLQGDVSAAGASFADLFGGAMALFRLAVVARPDATDTYGTLKLTVVHTAQGTDYQTTITDGDLLSFAGDPVVSVKRADSPNLINVTRQPHGTEAEDHLIFNDFAAVEAVGKREAAYRIDATDRDALRNAALPATVAHFAYDQTVQAVEITVHPCVDAEVGDAVWLTTAHPAVWTWSTNPGQVGYDGPARVVGKKTNLKASTVTLTLLVDGALRLEALSPAATVLAFDNAANPTWVEVPLTYLDHFAKAIAAAGAAVGVLHFQAGEAEGTAQRYTVATATEVAGKCRLTVASQAGAFTLDTAKVSTLTLPLTANVTPYQANFAHVGDGSQWA